MKMPSAKNAIGLLICCQVMAFILLSIGEVTMKGEPVEEWLILLIGVMMGLISWAGALLSWVGLVLLLHDKEEEE